MLPLGAAIMVPAIVQFCMLLQGWFRVILG